MNPDNQRYFRGQRNFCRNAQQAGSAEKNWYSYPPNLHPHSQIREFVEGRETGNHSGYQSLADQRVTRSRGRRPRGHYRHPGKVTNDNAYCRSFQYSSSDSVAKYQQESDNESTSSTQSFHFNYSYKSSDGNSTRSSFPDEVENMCTDNRQSQKFSTDNVNIDFNKFGVREDDINYTSNKNFRPDTNDSKMRLSDAQMAKEKYENTLKSLKPSDVIMDYRNAIDEKAKKCVQQNLQRIDKIWKLMQSQKQKESIFEYHMNNLKMQQKQFENHVTETKVLFSSIYCGDIDVSNLLKKADSIKVEFMNECKLFNRSLPGYALKSEILNLISNNQVTLISADNSYFLNAILPFVLKSKYKSSIICIESNNLLRNTLQRNFSVISNVEVENDLLDKKIYFVSEEEFLDDLMVDAQQFGEPIIVTLNLCLKRSIVADILIAKIVDLLQQQKESKFILLLSLYDDVYKYENYFSQSCRVSSLIAPKLTLPVKTIWRNAKLLPLDNYKDHVVNTALAIHSLNVPGDIMVFLPSSADVIAVSVTLKKRFLELEYKDVECIVLHENSPEKSCLELSYKKSSPNRSIFLSTSCAEILVIKSVQHVIDSGLRKDYIYDHQKCLDVLSTAFISHSACKLRRSLAGVFSSGFCYRIYSKENYAYEMLHEEHPDILSLNPFNTMIKIFQYEPNNPMDIDFVEPLPNGVKKSTMDLLKKCNAVKNEQLTALGKKMVKLPFPPKYSKFILLGIQWGYAYESIVLVAFFSVKGRIFKFSDNEDMQRRIDAAKLEFLQEESDTLSYLYIFKKWSESDYSPLWCNEHFINYDTLKNVNQKVSDMCEKIEDNLNESISSEFSEENCASDLIKMLFDCFYDNLCVYTGHYKSGYRVLSSRCIAFLHPSSMICQRENLPRFIIFDHMISTSREFLVDITSIDDSIVNNAITKNIIDFDYSDMFERNLIQKVIEPVGERVIKLMLLGKKGQKLAEIEKDIKKEINCELVVIEPSLEKGCVSVYALSAHIDIVVDKVNKLLKNSFDEFSNEEQVNTLELKKGDRKIPIEVKWLRGAIATSVKLSSLLTSGIMIQNKLDDNSSENETLSSIQHCINLTWTRRACNGKGYVTFANHTHFMSARKLAMKYIRVLDSEAFIQVSRNEKNQLFVSELPPETKDTDLKAALMKSLPGIEPENIHLTFVPPFETSEEDLNEIKAQIEENIEEFTSLDDYDVVIPKPKSTATVLKAYVNVPDEELLEAAAESLSNTMIQNFKVSAIPVYRSIIKCSLAVCKALKARFQKELPKFEAKLREEFKDMDLFTFNIIVLNDNTAGIKLLSNNSLIMKMLQRTVNNLLEGEVLSKNKVRDIHKLFCHGGHIWLRTAEKAENVLVLEDYKMKLIRLYGAQIDCAYAKKRIIEFLAHTEKEAVRTITIEKSNRKLLKAIIKEYGANLETFIELCKLRSAVLDIKLCQLLLHGSRESIEEAEECIRKLSSNIDPIGADEALFMGEMCPVCDCPALNLTFRLEHCGHLYCSECIQGLIEQANFPIQCCAENCFKEIFLDDICKILGEDADKIKVLLEKSMGDYFERNSADVAYCPAPDCSMFLYKREMIGSKWNCPLCQNEICLKCNVIYHKGLTCNIYQGSKNDPDYSFKVWKKTTSLCKECPKCKSAIEKNEGCDHMTCILCNAHFCWVCNQEFPNAEEVYNHIPFCTQHPRW